MSRTIESQLSLQDARNRILAEAEPGEPIEVSLGEALGLVLAEPVVADVDHPPFDQASHDGYAVRAEEATRGALLRVVVSKRSGRSGDSPIDAGEAARVEAGDPIPPGADTVLRPSAVRPDPGTGRARVIEVRRAARMDRDITLRGAYLGAGTILAHAGERIAPAMVALFAAQGCVHPLCHRRVRVAIVTVGHHWVRPDEAPTMNRERNATGSALAALTIRAEAMPHDFQAVAGRMIRPTLERATTSPIVVVLGSASRPLARALEALGYEPTVEGITVAGLGRVRSGVLRDEDGKVVNHVFHLPAHPAAASLGFSLLVQPLLARLQGSLSPDQPWLVSLGEGAEQRKTGCRARVVPATCHVAADGRRSAAPLSGPLDDLVAWSRADGALIFPERSGPWQSGDLVEFVPIVPRL